MATVTSTIRIFSVDDCTWMAAESPEAALKCYVEECHGDESDELEPEELSEEVMGRLLYHDDDGQVRTFRAELDKLISEGATFPRFFATTEY